MNFLRHSCIILALTTSVAIIFGIWGCLGLNQHLIVAIDHYGDAGNEMKSAATEMKETAQTSKASLVIFDAVLDQSIVTLEKVNSNCGKGHPCGTLADINQTLGSIRGATGQVEAAGRHENARLDDLDEQGNIIFHDVDTAIQKFNTTMDQAQPTVAGFGALVYSTNGAVTRFNTTMDSALLFNALTHASHTMTEVDQTVTDGHDWIHAKLYPTKKKGVIHAIEATGDVVHHWIPPIF